ncbi:hypothetical protein ACQKII_23035 [Lysinibacillus sp. NPDC048646]|uniref:hypothetical protein n=1 Tax=Lysinibacillus sp. NPDC048646 TaxID=3390574 RepID=UPI003D093EF6
MNPLYIGVIAIIIGIILIPVGYSEFKKELKIVKEQSKKKRIFVYLITFIGFLSLDNFIGWIFSLGILFIFIGTAFIVLTIF